VTYIPAKIPKTSFGSVDSAQETPIVQVGFYYGLGSKILIDTEESGSAVTVVSGELNCSTGTTANAHATARSKRHLIYKPGQGAVTKFTARFTTGVASSIQQAGFLSPIDGAGFGYDGITYGTFHKHGGEHELRNLEITAAATGTESLTIVVNGDSHTFNVTSGTVQHNANEIELELIDNIAGWDFQQIDDNTISFHRNDGAESGTYSFTNNSAGDCAGTWSQLNAGVTATTDWTAQASWNEDNNPFTIDPTKGNVYKATFQYLGYGNIEYCIVDPDTSNFIVVHRVKWANNNVSPNFSNPGMPIGWNAESQGSTTDVTVFGGSGSAFIQGFNVITEQPRAVQNQNGSVSSSFENIISIQNRLIFDSMGNHAELIPTLLAVSTDSTREISVAVYKDPVVSTASQNWQYNDEANSIALIDTTITTLYASGGRFIVGGQVNVSGVIDFEKLGVVLLPGERLSIFAKITGGAASTVDATLNWKEDI